MQIMQKHMPLAVIAVTTLLGAACTKMTDSSQAPSAAASSQPTTVPAPAPPPAPPSPAAVQTQNPPPPHAAPTYKPSQYKIKVVKKGFLEPVAGLSWPSKVLGFREFVSLLMPTVPEKWRGDEFSRNNLIKAEFPRIKEQLGSFAFEHLYPKVSGEYDFAKSLFHFETNADSVDLFGEGSHMGDPSVMVTLLPEPYLSVTDQGEGISNTAPRFVAELGHRVLASTGVPNDERGVWRFELPVPAASAKQYKEELGKFTFQSLIELDSIREWHRMPYVTGHLRAVRIISSERGEILYDSLAVAGKAN
jgi:hypothetical protein